MGNLPPSDPIPLPIYGGDKQDEVVKNRYALNTKTDDRHTMDGNFLMKSVFVTLNYAFSTALSSFQGVFVENRAAIRSCRGFFSLV